MLTQKQLQEIKSLQEICEVAGGFHLKLNDDMLANRSENRKDDFFHYEDGQLAGFLGCYGFGSKVEICGMVHPDYRRKGIFTKLLAAGIEEAKKQGAEKILLNAPTGSDSAKGFLKNIPCEFYVAEYQMKWEPTELTEDPSIIVRQSVSPEDFEAEIQLEVLCFGFKEEDAREFERELRDSRTEEMLIIEAEGKIAGKMRVSPTNGESWIYGFAVYPELQGRGIGRKALSKVVMMEHEKGQSIFLEVEAKNAHALRLYESCGFRSYHSQDYYKYQL
jgi:ribosomal protein S18 acetylase RimI-like enzyme